MASSEDSSASKPAAPVEAGVAAKDDGAQQGLPFSFVITGAVESGPYGLFALQTSTETTSWVSFVRYRDLNELHNTVVLKSPWLTPAELPPFPGKRPKLFTTNLSIQRTDPLNTYLLCLNNNLNTALHGKRKLSSKEIQQMVTILQFLTGSQLYLLASAGEVAAMQFCLEVALMDPSKPPLADKVGGTALHYAASAGQADIVRMLCKTGAALPHDKFGLTPLDVAHLSKHQECEKALAEHFSTTSTFASGTRTTSQPKLPLQYRKRFKDLKAMVLINPFSGTKKGPQQWDRIVCPMFKLAGQHQDNLTVIVTKRAGEAADIMRDSKDLDSYDMVMVLSGDGLTHEIVNGLRERADGRHLLRCLPFATLPAGSGNGFPVNLGWADIGEAAAAVTRGITRPIDLIQVTQLVDNDVKTCYAFLGVTWGLMSDIDFESEKFRWMGATRFTVEAVRRIATLKPYNCQLHYKEGTSNFDPPPIAITNDDCWCPPSDWTTVEDPNLNYLYINNASHASPDHIPAPDADLSDGLMEVTYMHGSNRAGVAKALIACETGTHLSLPNMHQKRACELVLVPQIEKNMVDVDGERFPNLPVHLAMLPSAAVCAC